MSKGILTSKDRVQAALKHKEPDRIPLDIGSTKMTGIHITAYRKLLEYKRWQNFDIQPEIADPVQQLALVHEDVLEKLRADTRGLFPSAPLQFQSNLQITGNYVKFTDEWGVQWKKPIDNGYYFDMSDHPLAYEMNSSILNGYKWPDPLDSDRTALFPARIADMKARGDYAFVVGGVCAGILEMALRLRGFEQFFTDLATDPDLACGLLDKIVEIKSAYWAKTLVQVGSEAVVVIEADDMGTQNSLLISPQMYRTYIKPRHKQLFSSIKRAAPSAKVFLHSCGAIKQLVPDFIEAGVDILNPIQVSSRNMETKALKKEFGDVLTFWGGAVDSQKVLPFGTPDEVREEVKRRIDDLAPGGGFIFTSIHNIQADVPPANIEAMLDTLERCGIY